MKAKVCGLTTAEDVAMVLAAGADLVGFLHHPPSSRHCPDLGLAARAGERAILVTVAAHAGEVLDRLRLCPTAWVQPYLPAQGRAAALRLLQDQGLKVLLPWPDDPDQEPLPADLYLWETSPRQTGLPGGSGQGHAMAHPPPGPFLLGGGLSGAILEERLHALPAGVREACQGFDAASRLEGADAPRKDPVRVRAFVATAHALSPLPRSQA